MNREEIIEGYSKSSFSDFLHYDQKGQILDVLNEEGLEILKNSSLREERINYILAFSPYINELCNNKLFVDVLLTSNIRSFYANLRNLSLESSDKLFKRSLELNLSNDIISELFSDLSLAYQIHLIEKEELSYDLIYEILRKVNIPIICNKILNKYNIDLSNDKIYLEGFFSNAKMSVLKALSKRKCENVIIEEINIPSRMITKDVAKRIWNEYDIFQVRKIINDANYVTDTSLINQYVKQQEECLIMSADKNGFIEPYSSFYTKYNMYLEIKRLYEHDNKYLENYEELAYKFLPQLKNVLGDEFYHIEDISFEQIEKRLRELNDFVLSNHIIDYHFEENYYNIMLDVRELLRFYFNGDVIIPTEHIELYEKISNIDYLPYEEKIELHQYLKQFNMMEMFYDDMRIARDVVNESIKEYSLSKETIQEYRDDALSLKYGVDVYKLDGDYFFGIVKSGNRMSDDYPTGHSFSLIGNNGLATFGDLENADTFLYDSDTLNPEQIVHVFPYDSFTLYKPFETILSFTDRVYTLGMPEELVGGSYNEILILEQGLKSTEFDKRISKLHKLALYCLDEIKEKDIQSAKENGVGIILVDSSKYFAYENKKRDIDNWHYNYFNGNYNKEEFEARRK